MAIPASLKLTKDEARLVSEANKATKARERERTTRERAEHKAYVGIAGAAIGVAERAGYLQRLPSVAGRYPYTAIAVLSTLAAFKMKPGTAQRVADAASDSALAIASYRMAATASVAGGEILSAARVTDPTRARELSEVGSDTRRRRLARERRELERLEDRLENAIAQVAGDDQPE